MKKIILFALILILHFVSKGQIACYTTTDTIGCIPYTVTLSHCGDDSKPTIYDYGDGSALTSSSSHTYTTAGYYNIMQLVSDNPIIDTFQVDSIVRAVDSNTPIFSSNTCINRQVKINCEDIGYDRYIVNYGDGSPFDTIQPNTDQLHTYSDSIVKTITIQGTYNYANCGSSSSRTIQPFVGLIVPTTLFLTNIEENQIEFNFTGHNHLNYSYSIQKTSDNSIYAQDSFQVENTDTIILTSISNNTVYTLSLVNFDFCGNTLNEDTYTSISLSTTAQDGKNLLSWNNNQTLITDFVIYKDTTPYDTVTTNINTYEDLDVLCGKEYCYQIKALHNNNYNSNTSNISCVTSINNVTPPALDSTHSSFNSQNKLEITWSNTAQIEVSNYIIQDIIGSIVTEFNYQGNTPFEVEHKPGHCYNVYYSDACNNTSSLSADTTCPIELNVTKEDQGYFLEYTNYHQYLGGTSNFEIEWFDSELNLIKNTSNSSLSYLDLITTDLPQQYYYRISSVPNNSSELERNSKLILIEQWHLMLFPNAFSPNSDGINDLFLPKHNHINKYSISIFNSWGKIVYTSEDIDEGWDGTTNGNDQSLGSYQYQVTYTDNLGGEHKKFGTIKLIR